MNALKDALLGLVPVPQGSTRGCPQGRPAPGCAAPSLVGPSRGTFSKSHCPEWKNLGNPYWCIRFGWTPQIRNWAMWGYVFAETLYETSSETVSYELFAVSKRGAVRHTLRLEQKSVANFLCFINPWRRQ